MTSADVANEIRASIYKRRALRGRIVVTWTPQGRCGATWHDVESIAYTSGYKDETCGGVCGIVKTYKEYGGI